MSERTRGTVKWFSNEKGYGFISQEDGPDLFVHYSEIQGSGYRSLDEGSSVEFEITDGKKGKQASAVILCGQREHSAVPPFSATLYMNAVKKQERSFLK